MNDEGREPHGPHFLATLDQLLAWGADPNRHLREPADAPGGAGVDPAFLYPKPPASPLRWVLAQGRMLLCMQQPLGYARQELLTLGVWESPCPRVPRLLQPGGGHGPRGGAAPGGSGRERCPRGRNWRLVSDGAVEDVHETRRLVSPGTSTQEALWSVPCPHCCRTGEAQCCAAVRCAVLCAHPACLSPSACSEHIKAIDNDDEDLRKVDLGQAGAGLLRSFAQRAMLLRAAGAPPLGEADRARVADAEVQDLFLGGGQMDVGGDINLE